MGDDRGGPDRGLIGRVRRLAQRFRAADSEMSNVLRGAGVAMVVRAIGAACAFLLNIVIGRMLGVEGAGYYFLALAFTTVIAIVVRLGMDGALLRVSGNENATENWGRLRSGFAKGLTIVGIVSGVASLIVAFGAEEIAIRLFKEPSLAPVLAWMAFSILTYSLMPILAECLKGIGRIRDSMMVAGAIYPVMTLVVLWPLVSLMGIPGAALAYTIGTGVSVLYGGFVWRKAIPRDTAPSDYPIAALAKSARSIWVMSVLSSAVLPWAPLFMLGIWHSSDEVGVYGAATRIVMILGFFVMTASTAVSSRYSRLIAAGDIAGLNHLVRRFILIVTLAASPIFLLLTFGGSLVLHLFGADFAVGGTALAILALGEGTRLLTGSAGNMLILNGYERDIRNSALVSVAVVLGLAMLLIPTYGGIGAAIASAAALASINVIDAINVYRRIGVIMLPGWPKSG
jgi:O-antigen/teichoic acid export membrane protein